MNRRIFVYVKWVLLISGTACLIGGCATDHWQGNQSIHEGLWKTCREGTEGSSSKEVKVRCSTCNVKNSTFDGKKLQLESKGKNLQRRPLHNKYVSCRLAALVKKTPLFSSAYCCFPEYCWVNISNLDITLFRNSLQYEIPFSPYYAMFKPHYKIQKNVRKVLF